MEILIASWCLSVVILVVYYQVVFLPRQRKEGVRLLEVQEGVSVVIAVKNGVDELATNLSFIVNQQYSLFEVIIVDDHSDAQEGLKLQSLVNSFPSVQVIHSNQPQGKKHALTIGIQHAQFPYILCTDADCRPITQQWISSMMSTKGDSAIVLGYSPYEKRSGWLNRLIRFETIMTAIQYISWTMLRRPYMAVGRNLLFSKAAFHQLNPFEHTLHIPYGDDDNLVQAATGKAAIEPCLDPLSFVSSQPPVTWRAWLRQKHRHLSAGFSYSKGTWWQPGLFAIALIWHWLALIVIWICCANTLLLIGMIIALALRWIIYASWTKQLQDRDTALYFPLLEMAYAIYLAYAGIWAVLAKRKTWN